MLDYNKMEWGPRQAAVRELEAHYAKAIGKLTSVQDEGIGNYAAGGHAHINFLMRNPEQAGEYGTADQQGIEWVNAIMEVMQKGKLPQTTRLYRGVMWDEYNNNSFGGELKEGLEWSEKSLISTSILREQAESFATEFGGRDWIRGEKPQSAVLHMIVPKDMPSINLNALTSYNEPDEEEILLAPSSWRADKIVEHDGVKHILARCTGLQMPAPFEIKTDPVLASGGYRRHPLAPIYYGGSGNTPDHGLADAYIRDEGTKLDHLAWIPQEIKAQKQAEAFIVDGEELEWGEANDYLVQDPNTGACWMADEHSFESVYKSHQIGYSF